MKTSEIIPTLLGNQEVKTDIIDQFTYDENGKMKNKLTTVGLTFINRDISYDDQGRVKEEYEVSYEGHGMKRKNLGVEKTQYQYISTDSTDETKITTFVKIFAEGTDKYRLAKINNELNFKQFNRRTVTEEKYNKDEIMIENQIDIYVDDELKDFVHREYTDEGEIFRKSVSFTELDDDDNEMLVIRTSEFDKEVQKTILKKSEVEGYKNRFITTKNDLSEGYNDEIHEYTEDGLIKSILRSGYSSSKHSVKTEFVNIYEKNKNNKLILVSKEFSCYDSTITENNHEWKSVNGKVGDVAVVVCPNHTYITTPSGSREDYDQIGGYYNQVIGYNQKYHFDESDLNCDLDFLDGVLTSYDFMDEDESHQYNVKANFNNRDYKFTIIVFDKKTGNVIQRVSTSIPKNRNAAKKLFFEIAEIAKEKILKKYSDYSYNIDFQHMDKTSIILNTYFDSIVEIL